MADKRATAKAAAPIAGNKKNQRNQSENRLDLLWTLLKDKKNLKNHEKLLQQHRNVIVRARVGTLETSVALRLHKSDLDSLIKNRGLSWETLHEYCTKRDGLVIGPIFISDDELGNGLSYTYIVNFAGFGLRAIQKPDKVNASELKSTLETLFKLWSSDESYKVESTILVAETPHYRLLEGIEIDAGYMRFDGDDCEFVRWMVENVPSICLGDGGTFVGDKWTTFCLTLTGSTSKVRGLIFNMTRLPSTEPSLPNLIRNAPTIKILNIYTFDIYDLIPFTTMKLEPGRTLKFVVQGMYTKDAWIGGLVMAVRCRLFSSISYGCSVENDYGESISFTDTGKEGLVDLVRANESLVELTWNFYQVGNLDVEFKVERIQPILDSRVFQKQAAEVGLTLESHGVGIGLLSKLLCSTHVLNSPTTLYGILKENVPLVKHLWDSGLDARITRLERIIRRSTRDFKAVKASKEERAAIFST